MSAGNGHWGKEATRGTSRALMALGRVQRGQRMMRWATFGPRQRLHPNSMQKCSCRPGHSVMLHKMWAQFSWKTLVKARGTYVRKNRIAMTSSNFTHQAMPGSNQGGLYVAQMWCGVSEHTKTRTNLLITLTVSGTLKWLLPADCERWPNIEWF